jgi:phosphoglycerate dehydrogenase-like enzyme
MGCRIWIRLNLSDTEFASLRERVPGCDFYHGMDVETYDQQLREISAVFTEEPLSEELTAKMPNLKWLHVTRGGVSAYLTAEVKRRPIQVTSSKGIHGPAFSEFALACIFALAKKLPECWEAQKRTKWQEIIPDDLEGKTLGIVGLGTVGTALAKKAAALGLKVIATKRTPAEKPDCVDELAGPEYLLALLQRSDFVVLTLASIPTTNNLIGEKELRAMKKSSYLINLTGGRVIEEGLLVRALKEGWIAGAALDAFARQPLPQDSELWCLPNVMVTPRIGGLAAQKWPHADFY